MRIIFYFLTVFLCFINKFSFSQQENNFWYFGNKTGIDFSSGSPIAKTDGALNSWEGSSSIADNKTGKLLFYTNGVTVWDCNHNPMPNGPGLMGGSRGLMPSSSTQSCIIVPDPCNFNRYYIFTTDCTENQDANGFRYSIVDMSLNGGLGIVTSKNILLFSPSTEKVTAVHHANKKDIWVITHGKGDNKFYAYLVTGSGVSAAVITNVGSVCKYTTGYLKISPNGKKLVYVEGSDWSVTEFSTQILDFDNNTGVISNPISLNIRYYGASFSSNSSKLYLSRGFILDQYDLLAGTPSDIIASRTDLNPDPRKYTFYGIQLGPDKKIYCTKGANAMHIIEKPDMPGLACNLMTDAFPLSSPCNMGVPNFVESFFDTTMFSFRIRIPPSSIFVSGHCVNEPIVFSSTLIFSEIDSVQWNFGESTAGKDNYLTTTFNPEVQHTYRIPGTYLIRAILFAECNVDTVYTSVEIIECENTLYVPNSFTPNGDGTNDLFYPKEKNIKDFNMKIFNRWGSLIYETNALDSGWDGKYNGSNCQQGVYVWLIKYRHIDSLEGGSRNAEEQSIVGKVTLLR